VDHDDAPLLVERVGQKPMLRCPWCEIWAPKDSFIALLMPPRFQEHLSVIYKHGGEAGCKKLFAPALEREAS
jgi:hypothetical protein